LVLRSVHLCDFPDVAAIDDAAELVSDMDRVRDACNAIASIRSAENIRNRQPLARVTLYGAAADRLREYGELIADEANVKEVTFAPSIEGVAEFSLTIDFKVAGKRLGAKMKEVGAAAKSGAWMRADNGDVIVCAEALRHDEYRLSLKPLVARGAAPLSSNDALVVLDLTVTPALEAEGRARDVVRLIQQARKEANLNVSDRVHILLNIPRPVMQAVEQHAEYVSSQTLADSLTLGDVVASAHVFTQEVEGEAWSVGVSKAA
jgi:isoleucyl-tRNA synthetase